MTNDSAPQEPGPATPHEHSFQIQIDRVHYTVSVPHLTGAQLRSIPPAPIDHDRDLFEVIPGQQDLKIEDTDTVEMHDGLRFFTAPAHINPGWTALLTTAPRIHQ